jgi:hypothetical protein
MLDYDIVMDYILSASMQSMKMQIVVFKRCGNDYEWDIWTLKCVLAFIDGLVAVPASNRKQMDIYRLASDQEPFKSLQSESNVTGLAVMPNCRLVSSHADGSLRFWR